MLLQSDICESGGFACKEIMYFEKIVDICHWVLCSIFLDVRLKCNYMYMFVFMFCRCVGVCRITAKALL